MAINFKKLFGGDFADEVKSVVFTPKGIIAGYIPLPNGADGLQAAWHASAITLDTERIRLIHRIADDGVYFLAASASEFVNHPDSETPLASALPGSEGYAGDGAYFVELGGGVIAVAVKRDRTLRCYVGEKADAIRFAGEVDHIHPGHSVPWVGYNEMERRQAHRIAGWGIGFGVLATAIFLLASLGTTVLADFLIKEKESSINHIRQEQQSAANQLNSVELDDFLKYRDLAAKVAAMNGRIVQFESKSGHDTWTVELPSWATGIEIFGAGLKVSRNGSDQSRILVVKS